MSELDERIRSLDAERQRLGTEDRPRPKMLDPGLKEIQDAYIDRLLHEVIDVLAHMVRDAEHQEER